MKEEIIFIFLHKLFSQTMLQSLKTLKNNYKSYFSITNKKSLTKDFSMKKNYKKPQKIFFISLWYRNQ